MAHPGRWGRYPTTGRPVSASSIGRSVLYKDFRAIIEQNAHDMAGRAELQKPLQLGSKGDA